jgi:Ca2+:H+ antiporter
MPHAANVHFDGIGGIQDAEQRHASPESYQAGTTPQRPTLMSYQGDSDRSLLSAPAALPEQHLRNSLRHSEISSRQNSHSRSITFGGLSKYAASRSIRRENKMALMKNMGWESSLQLDDSCQSDPFGGDLKVEADEMTELKDNRRHRSHLSASTIPEVEATPMEALKGMFLENKINVLLVFLPFAYISHAFQWNDGSIFVLNFLAMVPLASMLGVFTEELAAHTNDIIGGLINATFGNAVELVVAIQALLAEDYRVVQASLIGSVFSNLLLVLGMCFFVGGLKYDEQKFIALGAVASIALLALSGLTLYLPQQFVANEEDVETISRIGAFMLVVMYCSLLYFQLKTHAHCFNVDEDGENGVALIPFSWALIGLVIITAIVTILSEFLVASIDGFCEEFRLGRSFVGVIILPVVGNAVEHISAVSVAYKNKMDLALGGKFIY